MVDYYMFYTVKISLKISRKRNVIVLVSNAKAMATHSSTLAWKIPWTKSLVGCSPWGCEELDTTERLHFHFSLAWIGEGNGNPLQCSCLENPRDGGAWWPAVYGVSQSRTRLKRLSSIQNSSKSEEKTKKPNVKSVMQNLKQMSAIVWKLNKI